MNLQELLLSTLSRANTDYIAHWATEEPVNFEELYQLIFSDNLRLAWRATWVVEKTHLLQPELLTEKLPELMIALPTFKVDGIKRSVLLIILRSSQSTDIPVELINTCFDWMMSSTESFAVQVNSMKVLDKICRQIPDLRQELMTCLSGDLSNKSAGLQAAARIIHQSNRRLL